MKLIAYTFLALFASCSDDTSSPANSINQNAPSARGEGSDPLYSFQWYLKNSGEKILKFSDYRVGQDINWNYSSDYTGDGVSVVVSDGRIQLGHEDIVGNANYEGSRSYVDGISGDGGNPDEGSSSDNHGTFIAGIIGAERDNSIGITGVAGDVSLIGYNYIDSNQSLSITLDNYTSVTKSIFNYSFGYHNCEVTPASAAELKLLKSQTLEGNIYVTAAGNDFISTRDKCGGSDKDSYLGNSFLNEFKNLPEMIVVTAVNGVGVAADYSTPGPNVLVSAPGGASTSPMIGLDLEGCEEGQAVSDSSLDFDRGDDDRNRDCNYAISGMMGTSFAAPLVTGVMAQMRELCPSCDFRDIRHTLIMTASHRNDISWNYSHPLGIDLEGHDYHLGFVKNSFGLEFNNDLGFGVVDSSGALSFLLSSKPELYDRRDSVKENDQTFYSSGDVNILIPDNNKNGISSEIIVDSHNVSIEHILLNVRVNHSYISDLGIDLVSPSGTRHRLKYVNSNIFLSGDQTMMIGVNGFYGELSLGTWKIEIVDGHANDTGSLISWDMRLMGGKWGRELSTPSLSIDNLEVVGNTFSWGSNSTDVLRFEACIKPIEITCAEEDWFSIEKANNSFEVTTFKDLSWSAIVPDESYRFNIRAIDHNEMESDEVSLEWTVASE